MAFRNIMDSLGRLVGLYPDEETIQDGPAYDEYGAADMGEAQPPPAGHGGGYTTGYGGGNSYVRAGARPPKPQAGRREDMPPPPSQGFMARGKGQQQRPGPTRPVPDNVIPMPERDGGAAMHQAAIQQKAKLTTFIICLRRRDDSAEIINYLVDGVSVILNFEEVDDVTCQRILDIIVGATYALEASLERISHRNYLLAPKGVNIIRGEIKEQQAAQYYDEREFPGARPRREARAPHREESAYTQRVNAGGGDWVDGAPGYGAPSGYDAAPGYDAPSGYETQPSYHAAAGYDNRAAYDARSSGTRAGYDPRSGGTPQAAYDRWDTQ